MRIVDERWTLSTMYRYFPQAIRKKEKKSGEIELLYNFYEIVERNQPALLEPILHIVARYMRRYFGLHKYKVLDKVLDRVQRRFPSVVVGLYQQACDLVLINLLRSQYEEFVEYCLSDLKNRLAFVNREQDWKTFIDAFMKKHKGKKSLMQQAEFLIDGTFDIQDIRPKKKRKTSARLKKDKDSED